jgi:hypothetical protein
MSILTAFLSDLNRRQIQALRAEPRLTHSIRWASKNADSAAIFSTDGAFPCRNQPCSGRSASGYAASPSRSANSVAARKFSLTDCNSMCASACVISMGCSTHRPSVPLR